MSWLKIGRAARNKRVRARMEKKADAVAEYWKSVSPVFGNRAVDRRDTPPADTNKTGGGSYRDSITVTRVEKDGALSFKVGPHDRKATWVEYGNAHMPAFAPKAKVKAKFKGKR